MVSGFLTLLAILSCSFAVARCATAKTKECSCWHSFNDPEDALAHVCGINGQSYLDPCWAKCGGTVPAYYGNCTTKVKLGAGCKKCADVYDPVCGTDGVNYRSPCVSACAGVEIVSYGPCSNQKHADIKCKCPKQKTSSTAVCGADGETYLNECYAKCKGTTVKANGRCPFPKVSCNCTFEDRKTVCSGESQEYSNLCFANCAKSKPVHYGSCLGVGIMAPNNWMRWASYSVCGKDGKEYGNMCSAQCQNVTIDSMIYSECGGKPRKLR